MQHIIDQFQLENPVLLPEAIKVGIINQSFCLKSAVEGGKSYFLQRINHNIFQDVEGLQNNIDRVTAHIRQLLTEDKVIYYYPEMGHEIPSDWNKKIMTFFKERMK